MVLTIVIVAFGVVGVASGVTYWMGWLPAEQRTTPFKGGAHADLVLMGVSIVLIGSTGLVGSRVPGLVGLSFIAVGFVVWLSSPPWLLPRWYGQQFSDEQARPR